MLSFSPFTLSFTSDQYLINSAEAALGGNEDTLWEFGDV